MHQLLLIKLLNQILTGNESSILLLKQYANKKILLQFAIFNLAVAIGDDGFFTPLPKTQTQSKPICDEQDNQYDVIITIPLTIVNYCFDRDKLAAVKKLTFDGDSKFGLELLEILAGLQFNHLIGNDNSTFAVLVKQQLFKFLILLKNNFVRVAKNAAQSSSDYLLYHSQDIANKASLSKFYNEVDDLKSRIDLLQARIVNLAKKHP